MTSGQSENAENNERKNAAPVVLRISPTAHLASGFGALGLLAVVLAVPWTAPLLVIPVIASAMIVRLRTVADARTVTARTLLSSRTVDWADIKGLRFVKRSWARAELTSGEELRLPAVTFAMLPLLAEVSGGRVPNPYGSVAG
jgi:Bacterial PH domain